MTTTQTGVPAIRDEHWKAVPVIDGCAFSGYEASDMGKARSIDRQQGNRRLKGKVLAAKWHADGYVLTTIRCDSTEPGHNRAHTMSMHKLVLLTFAGPPGPGQEACHSERGPAFNWWPEGVRWDTKAANHRDQVEAGTAVVPASFPCRNAPRCPGMVKNAGRRCMACVAEVGRDTVTLLNARMPLGEVAERFGYRGTDWLFKLAVEHGYQGTKADAMAQRARGLQRVTLARASRNCHAQ